MKVWEVTYHEKDANEDSLAWSSDNIPAESFEQAYKIAKERLQKSKQGLKITKIQFLCYILETTEGGLF